MQTSSLARPGPARPAPSEVTQIPPGAEGKGTSGSYNTAPSNKNSNNKINFLKKQVHGIRLLYPGRITG